MRKLFLDDLRSIQMVYPNDNLNDWVIVRDFYQFVNYINKYGLPTFISFDHDLGFEHIRYFFENGGHENPLFDNLLQLNRLNLIIVFSNEKKNIAENNSI